MVKKESKSSYDAAVIEILLLKESDIITASDLFTESETPGGSSSSSSWT